MLTTTPTPAPMMQPRQTQQAHTTPAAMSMSLSRNEDEITRSTSPVLNNSVSAVAQASVIEKRSGGHPPPSPESYMSMYAPPPSEPAVDARAGPNLAPVEGTTAGESHVLDIITEHDEHDDDDGDEHGSSTMGSVIQLDVEHSPHWDPGPYTFLFLHFQQPRFP
jgi:hypothetical protein